MKKSIRKTAALVLAMIMASSMSLFVYAGQQTQNVRTVDNTYRYTSENSARTVAMPRGQLISSIAVQITDEGGGTAHVYGEILCHRSMRKILMWLYLEKWDEESEDWITQDSQQFEWEAQNLPEGEDLSMAMVSYNVPNQERGKDYRVRGVFGAFDLNSSLQEVWQDDSGEIMLE